MNFLGIRKYPEFFYNFLQFFLNFSELIMIFFNFAIRRFPFWDSSHQSISLFGQLPSINFLFGMFPIKIFPFWYFSEIKFLKFFQKKEISCQYPKKETSIPPVKLLFHFLTPQENTQKGNFLFWKFLKRTFFDIFAIKIFPKKETSIVLYNQLSIKEVSYIW